MIMIIIIIIIIIIITYPPIYIKLGSEVLHFVPFIIYELCDSRSNENYILLKGLKDILPVFLRFSSNVDIIPYKRPVSSNNH